MGSLFQLLIRVCRWAWGKRKWALAYVLLEAAFYYRHLQLVQQLESIDPFNRKSPSVDRRKYFEYCRDILVNYGSPVNAVLSFFQFRPSDRRRLRRIPRQSVLAALRFYLGFREEQATPHAYEVNPSLGYAVELNGGAESDRVIPFDELSSAAEAVMQQWEEQCAELAELPRGDPDLYRSEDNLLNFSRIGACQLTAWYKPIPVQAFIFGVRFVMLHLRLRMAGFSRRLSSHGIVFWTRWGEPGHNAPPLFLLHGIGLGVTPYVLVALRAASRAPDRTIVLPEWPNISFGTWRGRYPSSRELAWTLHQHLQHVQSDACPGKADAISHSYGTAALTYWMREFPGDLRRRVYIDPMNVGAEFGGYLNYSYERTLLARSWIDLWRVSEKPLPEWFIKGDISVQQLGKRATYLFEMWEHETEHWNSQACCVLSEFDEYVSCEETKAWFARKKLGCKLIIAPGWEHGGCVLESDQHRIWDAIFSFVFLDGEPSPVKRRRSSSMAQRIESFSKGLFQV